MEGNECYKFSTIKNYLVKTGQAPVRVAVDIGCNIGNVAALMREYFPRALVFAFEPMPEYYARACRQLSHDAMVKTLPIAVTAEQRFADDLGRLPLIPPTSLRIFRALPESGPGWLGGSQILRNGITPNNQAAYQPLSMDVNAITLDDVVDALCLLCNVREIDYVKFDCEGCENSALGCANALTLNTIRLLSGEYHDLSRFRRVVEKKLLVSHNVNLVGEDWGSFFAERRGANPSILSPKSRDPAQSLDSLTTGLSCFCDEFVLPNERLAHGLG